MDPLSEIREKIKRIANGNGYPACFTAKVSFNHKTIRKNEAGKK